MNTEPNSASTLRIIQAEIVMLPLAQISTHPDNRPLGANQEKIEQLKILITQDGFDASHPLVVRPWQQDYQLIEGEHRYWASKELGFSELPCVVRQLDDTEALIQLILGNTQSENSPLEIGLNALKVIQNEGKKAYTTTAYAQRLGLSETTIRRYINAAEVFQYLGQQLDQTATKLDEVYKLEELYRSPQEDWLWLHQLILDKDLSKTQIAEMVQASRDIKTDSMAVQDLFDLKALRQEVAQYALQNPGDRSRAEQYKELLQTVKTNYDNLDEHLSLFEYNVLQDEITEEELNLKAWFVSSLKELKNIDKAAVMECYKDALEMKRNSTREEAERTATYFRDKKNAEERQEHERIAREMRQVRLGEWWQLGNHWLYCGDAADPAFRAKLPEKIAFAFVNPPYQNALPEGDAAPVDWALDWLSEQASVVALTPALHEIHRYLQAIQLPYRWSMACWLAAKDKPDQSTWIYTALFGRDKNLSHRSKDHWRIEFKSGQKNIALLEQQGGKPYEFIEYLVNAFSEEGDTILDTHAQAGTSLLVAEDSQRICFAAEANPQRCKEAIEAWEKNSRQKAVRA